MISDSTLGSSPLATPRAMASLVPGREAFECFPATLVHEVDHDLQPTQVPASVPPAADARPSGDGKRRAKLKLAAAMLGVGLDGLCGDSAHRCSSLVVIRWRVR